MSYTNVFRSISSVMCSLRFSNPCFLPSVGEDLQRVPITLPMWDPSKVRLPDDYHKFRREANPIHYPPREELSWSQAS